MPSTAHHAKLGSLTTNNPEVSSTLKPGQLTTIYTPLLKAPELAHSMIELIAYQPPYTIRWQPLPWGEITVQSLINNIAPKQASTMIAQARLNALFEYYKIPSIVTTKLNQLTLTDRINLEFFLACYYHPNIVLMHDPSWPFAQDEAQQFQTNVSVLLEQGISTINITKKKEAHHISPDHCLLLGSTKALTYWNPIEQEALSYKVYDLQLERSLTVQESQQLRTNKLIIDQSLTATTNRIRIIFQGTQQQFQNDLKKWSLQGAPIIGSALYSSF